MTQESEQALNKAFADAKIASSKAGTYGRFGLYWDVKNGHPTLIKTAVEETKLLPQQDTK